MQEIKTIHLINGGYTIVDEDDYVELIKFRWFKSTHGYAFRQWNVHRNGWSKHFCLWMHRVVNQTPKGMFTDHANGNKLDNRKSNLRTCNKAQNTVNRPKNRINGTRYKGVSFHPSTSLWRARVDDKEWKKTTYHKTEEQAALDYNRMCKERFGEFAYFNVIPEGTKPTIPHKKTSKYIGVSFCSTIKKWLAQFRLDGKNTRFGAFDNEDDAARCYNEWSLKLRGDKAKLNAIPSA